MIFYVIYNYILKHVDSYRDRGRQGRHPRNCRRFSTLGGCSNVDRARSARIVLISRSAEPSLESLEKAAWEKRVKDQAKEFARPKKAKVCVDWHNTLEKDNSAPESHIQHLQLLTQHCSVFICSYVKSKWREQEVKRQVLALEKAMGLAFHFPCFS